MKTTNLENLKIHKLSRAQYQHLIDTDQIDETALYMVPEETVDLSSFATTEEMEAAIAAIPQSDWDQNDETAKDYIKNKPFGLVPAIEPVTWDCLPTDETITVTEIGAPEYKFADVYIPVEESAGISINANVNGVNYPLQLATSIIHIADQMSSFMFVSQEAALACVITSVAANTVYNGQTITSDSTYGFAMLQSEGTLNNITLNVNKVKQIDPKFYKDFPGEKTFGEVFTIDGEIVIASEGAEIFNSYGHGELTSAQRNIATGSFSHAEGIETIASGYAAHAQGSNTVASGEYSHAEGERTTASGNYAHAEGGGSTASGEYSHAEGAGSVASGKYSHAEGASTASGRYSHAEGEHVIAAGENQHVQGQYNIEDTGNTYAHIVGNGAANHRRNIHTLDWSGNAWFQGDVYIGSTSGDNKDEGSKKLATIDELTTAIADFATEDYVNQNGGKIDVIAVNGIDQTITNKKVDISVPTKTSELTNDSGYLTEHQDISGKADKTYTDTQDTITLNTAKSYTDTEVGKISTLVGDTSVASQISTAVDDLRVTITTVVMSAANWDVDAKTYSFEATYPATTHNLELELNGDVATEVQFEAFNAAMMVASANTNVVKAFGEVPTIDIPVILKVQVK